MRDSAIRTKHFGNRILWIWDGQRQLSSRRIRNVNGQLPFRRIRKGIDSCPLEG